MQTYYPCKIQKRRLFTKTNKKLFRTDRSSGEDFRATLKRLLKKLK